MTTWPYEYQAASGGIQVYPEDLAAELRTSLGRVAILPESEFPEFVSAIYAAAGKPAPVILERPERPRAGLIPGVDFRIRHGRIDVIQLAQATDQSGLYGPAEILTFAASLAILAGEARNEPDPAEVGDMAADILEAPDMRSEAIARHLLKLGYRKQQRGESRNG